MHKIKDSWTLTLSIAHGIPYTCIAEQCTCSQQLQVTNSYCSYLCRDGYLGLGAVLTLPPFMCTLQTSAIPTSFSFLCNHFYITCICALTIDKLMLLLMLMFQVLVVVCELQCVVLKNNIVYLLLVNFQSTYTSISNCMKCPV